MTLLFSLPVKKSSMTSADEIAWVQAGAMAEAEGEEEEIQRQHESEGSKSKFLEETIRAKLKITK